MKKEDIQKSALESCVIDNSIYNDEFQSYFMDGFKAGAQWRINSVWHDASEEPRRGEHILMRFKSGNLTSWFASADIYSVFKRFEVVAWAYVDDLLPSKED